MKHFLSSLRILPRWIIFFIDLLCVYAALIIGFLLRFNFDLDKIVTYQWPDILVTVGIVSTVCFILFQTFSGIIRHTGIQDASRVLIALSCIALMLLSANVICYGYGKAYIIPYSVIGITLFSAFVIMVAYRLLIKAIFDQVASPAGVVRSKTVIYGAGRAGAITCKILSAQSKKSNFQKVLAFIDDNADYSGKQLEGLKIYHATVYNIEKLYKRYSFNQIVVTTALQNSTNRKAVLEWCLEKKIKILQTPPESQWMQSKFSIRQIKDIHIEDLLNREVISIENKAVSEELTGKVILVTGAAGSIGSELVRQMAAFSTAQIILCDQAESPLHELRLELKESFPQLNVHTFLGNVCNKNRMKYLFETYHPQVIFHAAAYKHVPDMEKIPDVAVVNNVMGTLNMADLSVLYNVGKFIMISTDKAVNPANVMGASKRIAEIFIQSLNDHLQQDGPHTAFITTRFGNVLGSTGSVVPRFKKLIEQGGPVTVTHPEVTRFFMTIPEACQLVLQAVTMGKGGEIFAFDMGTPVKIADLAYKMIRLSGLEPDKDIKVTFTGLRPGEKLYEEVLGEKEDAIPTYHKKITIAKVRTYDFTIVENDIHELIGYAQKGNAWKVVELMKHIVPEYKSNNSIFEKLDAGALDENTGEQQPVPGPAAILPANQQPITHSL